jgi:hypothetical protein
VSRLLLVLQLPPHADLRWPQCARAFVGVLRDAHCAMQALLSWKLTTFMARIATATALPLAVLVPLLADPYQT